MVAAFFVPEGNPRKHLFPNGKRICAEGLLDALIETVLVLQEIPDISFPTQSSFRYGLEAWKREDAVNLIGLHPAKIEAIGKISVKR